MRLLQLSSLLLLVENGTLKAASAFSCVSSPPNRGLMTSTSKSLQDIPGSSTQLFESTNVDLQGENTSGEVDLDALLKYHSSIVIQLGLIAGLFKGFDTLYDVVGSPDIPTLALVPIFLAFSLKSRVFNPLDNERPNLQEAAENKESRGFQDRVMPSWTPPGPVFPIMWVLIIGPIRAYTAALVWQSNGHAFLHPAIFALMFHLAVGDVWNTMNNREQRFGASVTGVLCVTASALNAAYQFYTVDETAGNLLGLPMIWFAVASSLITATWRLNPSQATGEPESLYPVVRDGEQTRFSWFNVENE